MHPRIIITRRQVFTQNLIQSTTTEREIEDFGRRRSSRSGTKENSDGDVTRGQVWPCLEKKTHLTTPLPSNPQRLFLVLAIDSSTHTDTSFFFFFFFRIFFFNPDKNVSIISCFLLSWKLKLFDESNFPCRLCPGWCGFRRFLNRKETNPGPFFCDIIHTLTHIRVASEMDVVGHIV